MPGSDEFAEEVCHHFWSLWVYRLVDTLARVSLRMQRVGSLDSLVLESMNATRPGSEHDEMRLAVRIHSVTGDRWFALEDSRVICMRYRVDKSR